MGPDDGGEVVECGHGAVAECVDDGDFGKFDGDGVCREKSFEDVFDFGEDHLFLAVLNGLELGVYEFGHACDFGLVREFGECFFEAGGGKDAANGLECPGEKLFIG